MELINLPIHCRLSIHRVILLFLKHILQGFIFLEINIHHKCSGIHHLMPINCSYLYTLIHCLTSGRPQQDRATKLLNMRSQQLSVVIGMLTGHLSLNGHLYEIGKDIKVQKVSQRQ